ncbi:phosphoserine phosphatase SerB [Alsobacter sp. SYSU M60028]|uniref:Phosphoserine phosphatase n=1 Tax=Alsobacter ponti TaxID=2962936 RepID=A0ABT1L792_9HYPH|nr:phosphoserine phosphatase SerB [Alsobacter ponti]MCP8937209.1 phosphoserine phosphatase SerB [Alsobacter ponti]
MPCVATLVSSPARPALTDALLARAAQVLPRAGAPAWLAPGVAADLPFGEVDGDPRALSDLVRAALDGAPIDVVVQPRAGRRKKLFLADMDSTMIGQECIDELADFVGKKAHVAAITERAMRGEIAFEPALRERVALLRGLDAGIVAQVVAERITLTPGGRELVRTMRANGAHTALVSGGFTLFTSRIAEELGFHENRANVLVVEDDRFAGFVSEPILGREAKLASLIELRERHGLTPAETMAVGDGANDLAMLGEAGLGVAYHAKPAVAAAAHARIDHADLSALLYVQGYRRDEFVA